MKGLRLCTIGLMVAFALVLGSAGQSWAACGNNVLDFDPVKGTNEECDNGSRTCVGGLRAGQQCAGLADCPAGTCTGAGPNGNTGLGNVDDVGNACRSDCTLPSCGDGVSDSSLGEQCDDGNANDSDGCLSTCRRATCGDGFICNDNDPDFPCVTGLPLGAGVCAGNPAIACQFDVACGPFGPCGGKETCDDGNTKSGDGCFECFPEVCGDATVNGAEECDNGFGLCASGLLANSTCGATAECIGATFGAGCIVCAPDVFQGLIPPAGTCTGVIQPNPFAPNYNPMGVNRDDVAGACRSDCTLPTCGDGVSDSSAGEECDDGNDSNNDGCLNTCTLASCADGFICNQNNPLSGCNNVPIGGTLAGKEECDGGDVKGVAGCTGTDPQDPDAATLGECVLTSCGDGVQQAGEECDSGQAVCGGAANPLTLGADCATEADCLGNDCSGGDPFAGPATTNRDDVNDSCRSDCQLPRCGDGVTDADNNEQCDDGNTSNEDGCLNTCQEADCGDGFICSENNPASPCTSGPTGTKELCDDGNTKSADGCSSTCAPELCGDGVVNGSDQCDQGQATCTVGFAFGQPCATTADCGPGGTCSGGGPPATDNRDDVADSCRSNCVLPSCGDGQTDGVELCDDGNVSNNDTCLNNCRFNVCGDGNVCSNNDLKNPGAGSNCAGECLGTFQQGCLEECDDTPQPGADGCVVCHLTSCGDGIVQSGEECDTGTALCAGGGNSQDGNPCSTDADCFGGTCDVDANRDDLANHCRTNCTLPGCGDGVLDAGEVCDGAAAPGGESCTATCEANICTDGILGVSITTVNGVTEPRLEQCDDGNTVPGDGCSNSCIVEACGDGITASSFDPADHEECDAGIPLQHPDQNGGPTPVTNQGNCTNVCCWFGGVLPEGQASSPTLPEGTFTNINGAFDSLLGCHTPKLVDRSSCSGQLRRQAIRIDKLISQGRSAYNTAAFQKAIRKLRRAKRVIDRIDRTLSRASVNSSCASLSNQLSDQKNRIASLNRDVQNLMPLF